MCATNEEPIMVQYCMYLISSHSAFSALKRGVQQQWFTLAVDDAADAMGCMLMGGEL
jgi:hypothetical protein